VGPRRGAGRCRRITLLVALVGRPAIGLIDACRHLHRYPDRPERWQAPGLPDARAGEWPAEVATGLAGVVAGLTDHYKEDRLPLPDALRELEAIAEAAGPPPPGSVEASLAALSIDAAPAPRPLRRAPQAPLLESRPRARRM
jgi:hypothetical protein